MKTKTIQVGEHTFQSLKEATTFMQEFVASRKDQMPIEEVDFFLTKNKDFEFLMNLVRRHPYSDNKIGCGIKSFEIVRTVYNNYCLYLTRLDGSRTDFSWRECLNATPEEQSMVKAMRKAVDYQIIKWVKTHTHKGQLCCLCNKKLAEHVDHVPPNTFEEIAERFIKMRKNKPSQTSLEESQGENKVYHRGIIDTYSVDGLSGRRILDPVVEKEWQDYHENQSVLRYLCAFCNLSTSKKEHNASKRVDTQDTQN
jgi:hypothetical protein